MGINELMRRACEENRLISVLLELTCRCNLDCFFCYNDRSRREDELETKDWIRLLEDLSAMQVINLTLSGGEPLVHPGFFDIGAAARRLGFVVRIKTNGMAVDAAIAARVRREVDPFSLDVSLHGATPRTHDRQTRVPGSFERLLQSLEAMRAEGLRVRLHCPITAWNADELEQILALADRLGWPADVWPEVTPRDDGDSGVCAIAPTEEMIARVFSVISARLGEVPAPDTAAVRSSKSCAAGSSTLAVDPFGNVLPCVQWRTPIGNLRETSIREMWSEGALERVREVTGRARAMLDGLGDAADPAGFCPALASAWCGNPCGVYPAFAARLRAMEKLHGQRSDPLPTWESE